jgi:DNA polymerase II large subunit
MQAQGDEDSAITQSYLQARANQSSNHHPYKVQMNNDQPFQISFEQN